MPYFVRTHGKGAYEKGACGHVLSDLLFSAFSLVLDYQFPDVMNL